MMSVIVDLLRQWGSYVSSGRWAPRGSGRPGVEVTSVAAWPTWPWDDDTHDFDFRGARIRFVDHGSGPTLVLLHGMACCWQWWLECLPELSRHYRVIAVDLPGFGDSDELPEWDSIEDLADAVAALVRSRGVRRATVLGHSMGGLVAIAMSREHARLVDELVLVGSGGVPMSDRRLRAVLAVLRIAHWSFTRPVVLGLLANRRLVRRVLLRGAMRRPDAMSDELAAIVVPRLAAPAFLGAITASARAVRDSRPEDITTPTTLIWGEHDVFAPLHTARAMLSRLPHARLVVLAGAGHSPMVETPSEFCEVLIRTAVISSSHPTQTAL